MSSLPHTTPNSKRNWRIYFEWIEGKDYNILSQEFGLAQSTIKDICTSLVPPHIRKLPWQTANQYKNWREFKRAGMATSDTGTGRSKTE